MVPLMSVSRDGTWSPNPAATWTLISILASANVPRSALADVRAVLPGLNGPTIIDIANNGGSYVAVHAVVAASSVYRIISQLRALGGEGILVTRIERLVP